MIPELGHFSLIIAFAIAILLSIVPLVGAAKNDAAIMAVARPAALAQLLFIGLAYAALTHAFIVHDFSVLYVAEHSNLVQPLLYRISGVWGSHEGSLVAVVAYSVRVDHRSRCIQSQSARGAGRACAFSDGHDQCWLSCFHVVHLESFYPYFPGAGGW